MAGRILLGALAAAILALALAPSSQGRGGFFVVKVAKEKDGPFRNHLNRVIPNDETKSLWYLVKSKAGDDQPVFFYQEPPDAPEDLKVKWFKGQNDISHDVQTSGHDFNLQAGKSKLFQARVRATEPGVLYCLQGTAMTGGVFFNTAEGEINGGCPH
jgi:hypothetical protein